MNKLSQYKLLFDYARDIILFVTKEGYIVDANYAALWTYGYSYEEIVSKTVFDLRADNMGLMPSQVEKAYKEGISFETQHKRKDGSIFDVEVNARGVTSKTTPVIMCVIRDITERKQWEAELLRVLEELKDNNSMEQKLSLAAKKLLNIDYFDDAVNFVLAELGGFVDSDRTCLFMLSEEGLTVSNTHEWCSQRYKLRKHLLQDIKINRENWFMEKLYNGESICFRDMEDMPQEAEEVKQYLRAFGVKSVLILPIIALGRMVGYIVAETNDRYINWSLNNLNMIGTICELITMAYIRKSIEDKLKDSNKELSMTLDQLKQTQSQLVQQEKLAAIGQLAAGIAHEINNPLGFIISNSSTLSSYLRKYKDMVEEYRLFKHTLSGMNNPEIQKRIESLDRIEQEKKIDFIQEDIDELLKDTNDGLDRIGKIVGGLRLFSRSNQENQLEDYDLNVGIQNTLIVARNEIKYHAAIHTQYGELPLIQAIGGQINQVLLNLIINAVHAIKAKEQEEMGTIIIRTYHDAEYVYGEIEDSGIGIPEQNMGKLYIPFFTTKPNGQGTGLGLWISHEIIVSKHKGEIKVKSRPGEGTTFTFKLPISSDITDTDN